MLDADGAPRADDPHGPGAGADVRLDHVQVAAPPGCEAEARRFYGELLGMVEVAKPAALLGRGGVWFEQLHVGVEEPFAPALKAHPAFAVGRLDEVAARLAAAGCSVAWDSRVPGVRRFYTSDPWRNRLELLEDPASTAAGWAGRDLARCRSSAGSLSSSSPSGGQSRRPALIVDLIP